MTPRALQRTTTIRLPDPKHERLKQLAKARKISVNKLIEELATVAVGGVRCEMHFRALAAQGNPTRALELLDKLDR